MAKTYICETKIPKKTPEYYGDFLAEPEENIGFFVFRFSCEHRQKLTKQHNFFIYVSSIQIIYNLKFQNL
jgi:hypothetical protein